MRTPGNGLHLRQWNWQLEAPEKTCKDERKQRKEEVVDASVAKNKWACSELWCDF